MNKREADYMITLALDQLGLEIFPTPHNGLSESDYIVCATHRGLPISVMPAPNIIIPDEEGQNILRALQNKKIGNIPIEMKAGTTPVHKSSGRQLVMWVTAKYSLYARAMGDGRVIIRSGKAAAELTKSSQLLSLAKKGYLDVLSAGVALREEDK